jgi:hypothetical protein
MVRVNIGGRQDFLMQRLSRSRVVVMISQHVRHLRSRAGSADQKRNQPERQANCGSERELSLMFHGCTGAKLHAFNQATKAPWFLAPVGPEFWKWFSRFMAR